MDVSSVKAEIKAWERSFKASHGRDPTIQDIKLQPEIADKYKLYKKLSKAANNPGPSTSTHASSEPPSTPPRSRSRSHQPPSLLIQPRAIETTAPLASFNPFSPQKNKGKERDSAAKSRSKAISSPFKPRAPAIDPFPIKPSTFTSTPPKSPPAATSALSRARKRLRGEPVSPSPNKGKRRRIGSQTTLSFTKLVPDSSSSEEEGEHDLNSLFISNSPVKVPAGAKSFKLLFDESMGAKGDALTNGKASLARTNSTAGRGLFGANSSGGADDDESWDLNDIRPRVEKGKQKAVPFKSFTTESASVPHARVTAEGRKVAKRALSDTEEMETLDTSQAPSPGAFLLPPSPPPPDSRTKQFTNARGKGKAVPSSRKKAKTTDAESAVDEADGDDDDSDTSKANIRIVHRTQKRSHSTASTQGEYELDLDPDQILGYSGRGAPRGYDTLLAPEVELKGKFDVDLPDKLRRVLALESTESKTRDSQEERVVQGLVLGRRTAHYDPDKGGEIWEVGEDDVRQGVEGETRGDTEGEDDWEGEPVPWELGEL